MDKKLLGRRINAARKERGWTSERLSEICNINATYLRQIESGAKTPSLPVFVELCEALTVSPTYLLADSLPGAASQELDALLKDIRPLVERLPAGVLRAVATQRILEGIPCGIISRRMHFSRCYVYRLLDQACDRLCQMEEARLGLKKNEK